MIGATNIIEKPERFVRILCANIQAALDIISPARRKYRDLKFSLDPSNADVCGDKVNAEGKGTFSKFPPIISKDEKKTNRVAEYGGWGG